MLFCYWLFGGVKGTDNMIRLHIYRKKIIKDNYYANTTPVPVFVDDCHICDMKPADYTAVTVTPGTHKIVMKVPGLLSDPLTKEFTVDAGITDVYVAFRGRMGKYIDPVIFEIARYNIADFSCVPGNMTKVAMRCEDMALKSFIWCSVTIDGRMVGTMDGKHLDMVFTVPKGKHRVTFESLFEVGFACLDAREDFMQVLVNECGIICVYAPQNNPVSSNRQIKCVFTRTGRIVGCAGTTRIRIDTDINVNLKNGETKAVFISEGRHLLVIRANKIQTRELIVPDNCSEIDILIDNMDDISSITAKP